LDIKPDTLSKAIRQGRIKLPVLPPSENRTSLTKTERSVIDDQTGMGKVCTHTVYRVLAATSGTTAPVCFTSRLMLIMREYCSVYLPY